MPSRGFFDEYGKEDPSIIDKIRKAVAFFGKKGKPFSFYVFLSLAFHVSVFCLLLISRSSSYSVTGKGAAFAPDRKAFIRALSLQHPELRRREAQNKAGLDVLPEKEILSVLAEAPLLDPRFSERERVEIYREFLRQREKTADGVGFETSPPSSAGQKAAPLHGGKKVIYSGPFSSGGTILYKISPGHSGRLAEFRRSEQNERSRADVRGGYVRIPADKGVQDIPADLYFRNCPYEEILAVGKNLFYFATSFPSQISQGRPGISGVDRGRALSSGATEGLIFFIVKAVENLPPSPPPQTPKKPLVLTSGEMESLLDELMVLPETEQVERFKRDYLERYDPDTGNLPLLTKEFIHKNLEMVFIISDPLAAAFDHLEELFFNKQIQGFFETCGMDYMGSETGAEILLALASLLDFEKRTLRRLFEAYEPAKKVLTGGDAPLSVFSPKAKAFVLKETMETVLAAMERAEIRTEQELMGLYEIRLASLYRLIAASGKPFREHALFALGRLEWERGRHEDTLKAWRQIRSSYDRPEFRQALRIIDSFEAVSGGLSWDYSAVASRVSAVLSQESYRPNERQLKRLIKFKKWSLRYP